MISVIIVILRLNNYLVLNTLNCFTYLMPKALETLKNKNKIESDYNCTNALWFINKCFY